MEDVIPLRVKYPYLNVSFVIRKVDWYFPFLTETKNVLFTPYKFLISIRQIFHVSKHLKIQSGIWIVPWRTRLFLMLMICYTQGQVCLLYRFMFQISLNFFLRNFMNPFVFSIPVLKSIRAKWVYHDCVISIHHKKTMAELVELDMVEFDVI